MTSYNKVAEKYSDSMSEEGDFYHKNFIDPALYSMVGNPMGKTIYDIGCGNGYMARYFAKKGAKVYASDISAKLVNIAKKKSKDLKIAYSVHEAIDFSKYENNMFDVVTMNMVIHYIKDLNKLFDGVSRVLNKNGEFIFSNNHFLRPQYPYSEWVKGGSKGEDKLYIKITDYLQQKEVKASHWLDESVKLTLYERPLKTFVNSMAKRNIYITQVEEIDPGDMGKDFSTKLQKSHHVPTFIIIGCSKFN